MKKIYITWIFILNITGCFSQSIVTSNKLWDNIIYYYMSFQIGTEHIKFTNDTVIDTITYKQVERSLDEAQLNWSPYGFIRENANKQVFYKVHASDTDRLLFDLNAQLHDTIHAYTLITAYGTMTLMTAPFYVNLIDSVRIGQVFRKRINLGLFPYDSLSVYERWVDSTGSLKGGMLHNYCHYVGCDSQFLVCYFEDGILKYHDPSLSSCYNATAMDEATDTAPEVTIFPNPITDVSTLNINGVKDISSISIRLYNILGREVLSRQGENRIEIDKKDIAPGAYFYRMVLNKKIMRTGKLVVN